MHKNIKTVAGCLTRVTCDITAPEGVNTTLTAFLVYEGESRPATLESADVIIFPAVPYGHYAYEIRCGGKPVAFGHLLVRPSAFPHTDGVVDYSLAVDLSTTAAAHVELTLTPGPRGPKGDTGASAYDIAALNGYQGSEADWIAELQGAQAAASAAKASEQAAATSAASAASTLNAAAKKNENNTFTATNTFNGSLVANSGITLGSQPLDKLLTAPSALELMTAGWHPLSGEATTFAEWEALNPDWKTRELLIMYAPKITSALPIFTARNAVKSSVIVFSGTLPYSTDGTPSYNYGVSDMRMLTFGNYISGGVNVYNCQRLHLYAPNAVSIDGNNALGYLNATKSTGMEVVLYLPKVANIPQLGGNSIFYQWGPISSLSCYMPLVVNSFIFGRKVSGAAQTCAVLKSLVQGLGTPSSVKTINIYPTKDGAEVADEATGQTKFEALQAFAATKNWNFVEKT